MLRDTVVDFSWLSCDMRLLVPHQITTNMAKLRLNSRSPPTICNSVWGFAEVRERAPTASAKPNTASVNFLIGESFNISRQQQVSRTWLQKLCHILKNFSSCLSYAVCRNSSTPFS